MTVSRQSQCSIIYEGHLHEENLGGGRHHFIGVLQGLSKIEGLKVIPILPKYGGVPFLRLPVTEQVHALWCGRRRGVIGAFRYEVKKVFMYLRLGLRALTNRERPVLITRLSYHGFSTAFARLAGMRVVLEVNGDLLQETRQRKLGPVVEMLTRLLFRMQVNVAHALVAVTPGIAASLPASTRPTLVLPNGAALQEFPPLDRATQPPSTRVAVYIGTLAPWYELELVLDALVNLNERNRERWRLVVVGDGEERDAFLSAVAQKNLTEAVSFRGWLPHEELRDVLRQSTLCLAPRAGPSSGSPIKLFEYLASNVPVVGSDVDGIAEIEHPLLCHYRQGDLESLVTAMDEAAATPPLTGDRLETWRKAVSWDDRVEQLLEFFDEHGLLGANHEQRS